MSTIIPTGDLSIAQSSPFNPVFAQSALASKRSSAISISTTKSSLRASNAILLDALQNLQTELFTHRSIMLDIQQRMSQMEQRKTLFNYSEMQGDMKNPDEVTRTERWQSCQNFAKDSNPPMSAGAFLPTPRHSDASADWEKQLSPVFVRAAPETPPVTPPETEDEEVVQKIEDLKIEEPGRRSITKTVEIEVKESVSPSVPKRAYAPVVRDFAATGMEKEAVEDLSGPPRPALKRKPSSRAKYQAVVKNPKTGQLETMIIRFHHKNDLK